MSFEKSKSDPVLGMKVFEHLKAKGYLTTELPVGTERKENDKKIEEITEQMTQVIRSLGLNPDDPQLVETPKRVAKMWVNELMGGLDWSRFPKCTMFPAGKYSANSFVLEKHAPIISVCAHHLMPFFGLSGQNGHYDFGPSATIAYIPKGEIIGISKLARITQFLSARPCNQEELCDMIREALCFILGTKDVVVYMEAYHTCQTCRGVGANGSMVVLSASGRFQSDQILRNEFLTAAKA